MISLDFLSFIFNTNHLTWLAKFFLTLILFVYLLVSFLFFRQIAVLERFLATKLGKPLRLLSAAALLLSLVLMMAVWWV